MPHSKEQAPGIPALQRASAAMLHDLCEPLHSALFATAELRRPDFDPAKRDRYLGQLAQSLEQALELISAFRRQLHGNDRD